MNLSDNLVYQYQVGGSLPINAPSYVKRQADNDLYDGLKLGEFCYVLNSRQMGKSSLRVQTMKRLQAEGIVCAAIDITAIGTYNITPEQWYAGIIDSIIGSLELYDRFDLDEWWEAHSLLSFVQRFSKFIEEVLLKYISSNIVIFVDEIDSTLSLNFNIDDFFAVIRECYNRRADRPDYRRITFVLIGVSTPGDLIKDKQRTPFNIGRAIELSGFKLEESEPLARGLKERCSHLQSVLTDILVWTGGQPFLTQKVCQIVVNYCRNHLPSIGCQVGEDGKCVEQLVKTQIIENWEVKDQPEHLRTIRDRILRNEQRASRLLGLYQQILLAGEIASDDSDEQIDLRLSGLVVKREGFLRVANRIYQEVFNSEWIEQELGKLRPYGESLQAWLASNYQDDSRLLRGKSLQDALVWTETKSLSDEDYHFLNASQQKALEAEKQARQLEKLEAEVALEAERKARIEAQLEKEKRLRQFAQTRNRIAIIYLILVSAISVWALTERQKSANGKFNAELTNLALYSENLFANNQELDALIIALKAGRQLKKTSIKEDTRDRVLTALQQVIYSIKERNRLVADIHFVEMVGFSPNGKIIASVGNDQKIKLWDFQGRLLTTLKGNGSKVYDVSFSPDGKKIASASADKTIKLWNLQGQQLATFKGHYDEVYSVSFSPDGKNIVSASADKTIKLWNLQGKQLATSKGHSNQVYDVRFSPDGKILASVSADKTIKLWNLQGKQLTTFKIYSNRIGSLNFSPDGKIIAASDDNKINLWNLQGKQLATFKANIDTFSNVSFSPDGKTIAAGNDRSIKLLNLQGQELATLKGHRDGILWVSFSPDGKTIASASGLGDKTIELWNLQGQDSVTFKGHRHWIISLSCSPDGKTLASGSLDNTIKLWNLQGKLLATLKGHSDGILSVNFSPDGKTIASGSHDNTIKLWNLQGKLLATLKGHQYSVNQVSFSTDGKTIASASFDKTIKLWNLQGKQLATFKGHHGWVYSVSFSPDGQTLASGSLDKTIKLWNLQGKELATFQGHRDSVFDVKFSPDGKTIASASNDKTLKLWNLQGQELATLKGHNGYVNAVSFSSDGKNIVSASGDNTVKVWNLQGQELFTLKGHSDRVFDAKFSPDGKTIASASADKTIILWHLDVDSLLVRGCNWAHDYLNNPNADLSEEDRHVCDGITPQNHL